VTAASKEKVLDALGGAASNLRTELGESLATVQKLDVPLSEATTSSLGALQAFSLGNKAYAEKGIAPALDYNQRAVQLDPNFAMGYRALGAEYNTLGEPKRASEYYAKAYELRDHASEREKLAITADYYEGVTGEVEKAARAYQEWIESYPRDKVAHINLGSLYMGGGSLRRRRRSTAKPCNLLQIMSARTKALRSACSPYSDSMKRGRPSSRRRGESWMTSPRTTFSTVWLLSCRIPLGWRNSNSGSRASRNMRTLDWCWHPIQRRMSAIWGRRGS
jgi:tetratricopeptide (TPR) repeat protein